MEALHHFHLHATVRAYALESGLEILRNENMPRVQAELGPPPLHSVYWEYGTEDDLSPEISIPFLEGAIALAGTPEITRHLTHLSSIQVKAEQCPVPRNLHLGISVPGHSVTSFLLRTE